MSTEKIGGDFELDRAKLLGKGAWGEVFIGKQISLNRPVAIKLLKKELTADPDFVRRFRREAECLAKLAEEHIIQVYSAGEYQGSHYFIMEYVQGTPLSKLIEKHRKFSVEEIAYVAISVTKALKSAWNSPAHIVHRDIKPANIMVSFSSSIISPAPQEDKSANLFIMNLNLKDTQIKVMDFGLAKLVREDQEATLVGTVIGTPKYISPEQGMGNPADIRSDMYSLGIVLYELATGKIPFESESAVSMIRHHIYDTALMISHQVADFPVELEAIIMKCIQKDQNSRYANPPQLLEDLDAFEKSKPLIYAKVDHTRVSATSAEATLLVSSSVVRAKQQKKRKVIIASTVLSTLVVATALILWLAVFNKKPPEKPLSPDITQRPPGGDIVTPGIPPSPPIDNQTTSAKEIDKREKLRLSEAMKSSPLKPIEDTKTKEHQEFNLIIQSIKSNDYEAARRETEKLMDLRDDIISPAAIYLQMRIWNISQGKLYVLEMKRLYNRFEAFYPKNDYLPLAQKLYADACILAESNSVDEIIAEADKEKNLQPRIEILKGFIKNNETNKFIQKVKDKLSSTYEEIKRVREENYQNTIAQSKEQSRINNFNQAFSLLDKAREYADDFSEIDQLKLKIEKEFLEFCVIEPLTNERDTDSLSFLEIKNIEDNSEMILITAGEFIRGDNHAPSNEEKPSMKVKLKSYYIDKFEITNQQFKKFIDANKYVTESETAGFGWVYHDGILSNVKGACWKDPNGDSKGIANLLSHPVVQVSLKDAENYAKWARKRLLTEAEWEKAARSDKELIYPWGNKWIEKASNSGGDTRATAPVGSYPQDKSPYGCYDIAGNVAEWCADYYDPLYYQSRVTDNPKGPSNGECYVIRGGSWITASTGVRLTIRKGGFSPTQKSHTTSQFWTNYLGFRCARDILSLK